MSVFCVGRRIDFLQVAVDSFEVFGRDKLCGIANHMDNVVLYMGVVKSGIDRVRKSREHVHASSEDVVDAASFYVRKDAHPKFCVFGVGELEVHNLFSAFPIVRQGHVNGRVSYFLPFAKIFLQGQSLQHHRFYSLFLFKIFLNQLIIFLNKDSFCLLNSSYLRCNSSYFCCNVISSEGSFES